MNTTLKKINVIILIGIAMLSSYLLINSQRSIKNKQELKIATVINSNNKIAEFKLTDISGNNFTNRNLRGKWNLLFFGYTSCPDICPATLNIVKNAWNKMPANKPKPANFIFVSINPQQDTTLELKNFVQHFHNDFNGVTGNTEQVLQLQKQLGIFAFKTGDGQNELERIEHTSALMLLNPETKLSAILTPPFTADDIIADLKLLTKS